ncbi:hypothetical protein, partial [Natrinema versiforme]|uniref:hypothetical protein n=1 Tax=Natrinema versiforme TaxID=88724 RepID=UPI00195543FE
WLSPNPLQYARIVGTSRHERRLERSFRYFREASEISPRDSDGYRKCCVVIGVVFSGSLIAAFDQHIPDEECLTRVAKTNL